MIITAEYVNISLTHDEAALLYSIVNEFLNTKPDNEEFVDLLKNFRSNLYPMI